MEQNNRTFFKAVPAPPFLERTDSRQETWWCRRAGAPAVRCRGGPRARNVLEVSEGLSS